MASLSAKQADFILQDIQNVRDRLSQAVDLQLLSFLYVVQGVCIEPGVHLLLERSAPSVTRGREYPTPAGETGGQGLVLGSHGGEELLGELGTVAAATVEQDDRMGMWALGEVDVGFREFHALDLLLSWSDARLGF